MKLLSKYNLSGLELKNRVVMAPMTRSRAIGNIPNDLMAAYYKERASNGLIISEGTSPSPNGLGYPRIPGIFSEEQIAGWKLVIDAVHSEGAKFFIQLMHTGRVSHPLNMPQVAKVLAPSAIQISGQMWTDQEGLQNYPVAQEMTIEEIKNAIDEHVSASINSIKAGADGVELHGANGYLIEQFLSPDSNLRTDEYGGSIENRCKFAIEVTQKVVEAIGKDKVGIRISPYGAFNDIKPYDSLDETYDYLTKELNKLNIAYIHIVDHQSMGAPEVPQNIKETIKNNFKNTIILSGGYDKDRAEKDLNDEKGDLVAFGRPILANPDFINKITNNIELNQPNYDLLYTPGIEGYTDYPTA